MDFLCRSIKDGSYRIYQDWGLLDNATSIVNAHQMRGPFFIISDDRVFRIYGKRLIQALSPASTFHFLVRPGETSKSLANWKHIQDFFLQKGADRRSIVVAFGGGVIGDLAGFAASTYMRGLDLIQIPTTVLSQSDSSIGAKVAVNHPQAKNLIGSFYQPKLVLTDPALLATLPQREFAAGLGEAIKYGVIADKELFNTLDEHIQEILSYNKEFLNQLILRCISIKIRVVEEDERETGLRKILNFGHTVGHALEQATHYRRFRHGEAVAWGMLAAGRIAIGRGMWDRAEFERLQSIIRRAGSLYPLGRLKPSQVLVSMKHDKKKVGKKLTFVLPEETGKVTLVSDITEEEIKESLRYIFSLDPKKTGRIN
jgi:3-dehydroquinate synthase